MGRQDRPLDAEVLNTKSNKRAASQPVRRFLFV
jgi:hypothetical protein